MGKDGHPSLDFFSYVGETHRLKSGMGDFPGGPVVKNPPCNAGDMGLIPGWKIMVPHAAEQLSLRAPTAELAHHN